MKSQARVIVVGAGPVGLLSALKLARAGIAVGLLEALPALHQSPRAMAYHPCTIEALDDLGLLDDMLVNGLRSEECQWRTIEGDILLRVELSVLKGRTKYPFILHLGQNHLAAIILRHLLREPSVEVFWGHEVIEVQQTSDGVTVLARSPEGEQRHEAAWLVGADGASSAVRKAVGQIFHGETWPERYVVVNVLSDFLPYGYASTNFTVDPDDFGIIASIDKSGLWRVSFSESPDLPMEAFEERTTKRLTRLVPGPYELVETSPYRVHQRVADSFRTGRVLLAGDAAHANCPIGGLGLTGGLLDAVAVGDALCSVILQGASVDLLDACAAERREIFTTFTSPTTVENERRLSESDPQKQALDRQQFKKIQSDTKLQGDIMLSSYKLVGRSYAQPQ